MDLKKYLENLINEQQNSAQKRKEDVDNFLTSGMTNKQKEFVKNPVRGMSDEDAATMMPAMGITKSMRVLGPFAGKITDRLASQLSTKKTPNEGTLNTIKSVAEETGKTPSEVYQLMKKMDLGGSEAKTLDSIQKDMYSKNPTYQFFNDMAEKYNKASGDFSREDFNDVIKLLNERNPDKYAIPERSENVEKFNRMKKALMQQELPNKYQQKIRLPESE